MSLFVAHGRDGLPVAEPSALARLRGLCEGGDASVHVEGNTVLCHASERRADMDVAVEGATGTKGFAAVYGDAYHSGDRLTANTFRRLAPDRLADVNGEFAGVIKERDALRLATDRLNLRQLFCFVASDLFVACSNVLPIVAFLGEIDRADELTVDRTALTEFLDFGHLLGHKTQFEEITLLPEAALSTVRPTLNGFELDESVYWEFEYGDYYESQSAAAEALATAFADAIALRTNDRLRYGLHLSGGLDSRLILASAPRSVDLTGYGFGVAGDEMRIGRLAARVAGAPFRFFPLESDYLVDHAAKGVAITDGMTPIHNFHHLPSMSGMAAVCDMLFLGTSLDVPLAGSKLPQTALTGEFGTVDLYEETTDFDTLLWQAAFSDSPFDRNCSRTSLAESFDSESFGHRCNALDVWNMHNRQARYIFRGPQSISAFLPVSNPIGDSYLIEAMSRIPPELRVSGDVRNGMLRRLSRKLSFVPYQGTWAPPRFPWLEYVVRPARYLADNKGPRRHLPFVSPEITVGYPDYAEWLRRNRRFNGFVREKLLAFADRGYCDAAPLREALDRHERTEANYVDELLTIVTLELWHERVLDRYPKLPNPMVD